MLAQARYLTQLESDNNVTLARLKAPFDAGDIVDSSDEVRVGTDEPLFDNQGLISDNESSHDVDPGADVGNSSDED